ncbi:hypothetical protein DB30_02821 [Enhygromyxa salina]|uniref:Uncharacterized protein n=1 Tax=Enhygromyxa salina TaxID=215803 RepID=A0A0C2A340_9BACT|nr:hypothetical protein DB30_02821 [Enhygromyxa salina]
MNPETGEAEPCDLDVGLPQLRLISAGDMIDVHIGSGYFDGVAPHAKPDRS